MRRMPHVVARLSPAVLGLGALLAGCAMPDTQAPTAAAQSVERNIVFFSLWSARLDDPAMAVIAHVTQEAKAQPTLPITVVAFADPTGSAKANVLVSQLRAQLVSDQLVADGIAPGRIRREARGATSYIGDAQESRRVEIDVGG